MDFLDECTTYFDSNNLYDILEISKEATDAQIKSAYRKKSLKVHPDRVSEDRKEHAKRAFQTLTKIHYILTNNDLRKVYDETGFIVTDDNSFEAFSSFEEYDNYWRLLFPKITVKQLDDFFQKYIGSDEEESDLKKLFIRFEGDMDKIYEYHFGYDSEERIVDCLNKLIDEKEIPAFDNYINEPKSKRDKRIKRINKEKQLAEKEEKKQQSKKQKLSNGESDLIMAIRRNASNNFDSMIQNLEAKYSKPSKNNKRRMK